MGSMSKKICCNKGFSQGLIAYDRLAQLQNKIVDSAEEEIEIHLLKDGRLGRTFTFLLGCLPLLGKEYGKMVKLYLPPHAMNNAKDMDVYQYYSNPKTKLQRFRKIETNEDIFTLVLEIINDVPVNMSDSLQDELISKFGEMYNNAFEHSGTKCIMGGKYFKYDKGKKYCFSCYDTGVGIPKKVKDFLEKEISDEEALAWALKNGNTTNSGVSRGLGIHLLLSFAKANNGAIRICTGNVLYTYSNKTGERYEELVNRFHGTLIEMDVIQDKESTYELGGDENEN